MNTLHLSYAVEVERCGSITQAAENLYMAQPNLSKAIRELETSMGFPIFARTSRGVAPTARGREFLIYARAILAQEQKMKTLSSLHNNALQRFSLALSPGGCIGACFSHLLDTLSAGRPMDIRVRELTARQAITAIEDGAFQLAEIRVGAESLPAAREYLSGKGLNCRVLWTYEALALLSVRHPLAKAPRIAERDLLPYPLVTDGEEQPREGESRLQAEERELQLSLISRLTTARMWSAPESVKTMRRYELVQRACAEGAPRFADLLIFPADYPLSELDQRFVSLAEEACGSLAQTRYD
ncbi:MAG: LysR family transcriptional regulator [Clostridia bacterium]|nr:LysR family transcriptional regulator [Clostridia bacterium]